METDGDAFVATSWGKSWGHNSHLVRGLGVPDVYNAQRTGMSKTPTAAPPEDHWSRSFIPIEVTQACGNLSRWHWEENELWGHSDLDLNLGSAAYQLCDPSTFLNPSELQFQNVI